MLNKYKLRNHKKNCNICRSNVKREIEIKYINWYPIEKLQTEYGLTREEIMEHSIVYNLCDEKYRRIRVGIVRVIEGFDSNNFKSKDIIDLMKIVNSSPLKGGKRSKNKSDESDRLSEILDSLSEDNEEQNK